MCCAFHCIAFKLWLSSGHSLNQKSSIQYRIKQLKSHYDSLFILLPSSVISHWNDEMNFQTNFTCGWISSLYFHWFVNAFVGNILIKWVSWSELCNICAKTIELYSHNMMNVDKIAEKSNWTIQKLDFDMLDHKTESIRIRPGSIQYLK